MKISTLVITLSLLSPSFSLFAAQSGSEPSGRELGTVSVSGIRGDMDDAIHALQMKGKELGGQRIKIISLDSPGDSDVYLGTAEVFSR
ncbi:DUF1471 domain-containing protein [Klebsiella variicola]|uniref:DUF1471 domain-containing protein n=1 Tax=Klebsiella variicola TaxID=244366 RepID=UPI000D74CC3A|nr:DUF1471 domain-containing protein [Klebsiella variicola]PXL17011.1 hypothetical protein DMS66_22490 [Klebsiella variicola]PXL41666.1 hypothetical protein DMS47_21180 [Klebsiella variicola]PXL62958.1 hypothetical protein DMS56_26295 [Klebsiella variicola]